MKNNLDPFLRVARTRGAVALAAAVLLTGCSTVSEARPHEGGPVSVSSGEAVFEDAGGDMICGSITKAVTAQPSQEADISNVTATGTAYGFPPGELPMNPGDCADNERVWIIHEDATIPAS